MALRMKDISKTENFTEQFILAEDGPDGSSTYPECWGAQAQFAARAVDQAATLVEAKKKADSSQIIIDTLTRREVWRGSKL